MRTFVDGRHGKDGLAAYGFDCAIFPDGDEPLRERIDRFASFLDRLRAPRAGVVSRRDARVQRGRLDQPRFSARVPRTRARDRGDRCRSQRRTAGSSPTTRAATLRFARMPTHVLADMDVASPVHDVAQRTSPEHGIPDPDNAKKQRWKLYGDAVGDARRAPVPARRRRACRSTTCRATAW